MKEEDLTVLAQLVSAMDEAVDKLAKFYEERDLQNFESAKKEVLSLQARIERLL